METKQIQVYIVLVVLSLIPSHSLADKQKRNEKSYELEWCEINGGKSHRLPNRTTVDCLTDTHAIEFDFSKKWYEAIGQSLYYSMQTGKRAGIVLIVRKQKKYKHWIRLNSTIEYFQMPIDTWIIRDF